MNKPQFEKTNDPKILLANAKKAVSLCKELTPGSGMLFFIPPDRDIKNMQSDERVELVCMPTCTLAAYLIHCKMCLKEQFTQDQELEQGFKGILLASANCGCDAGKDLVDALEIFLTAPLKPFLTEHAKQYPEFAKCAESAIQALYGIAKGELHSPWGKNEELQKRAKALVTQWEKA